MRYPRELIDQIRHAADIVQVVQEYVPLRKAGTTYKGLCPFHGERTPSFTVNRDKGFFHCFGCGQGGDVFKFVELQEGVGFQDAVKRVAARCGITLPEAPASPEAHAEEAEREALLKAHELARAFYAEQLASPAGTAARELLKRRDVRSEAVETFGIGYAPPSRDMLVRHLKQQGFSPGQLVRGGLAVQRDDGSVVDRFRQRLLFPIHREGGSVVAFGGRAMADDQVPKYLNSPETPLYTKGRVLYGLHLSKHAIRKAGSVVMMEGYFDVLQAWQGGVAHTVASSGTALTQSQAQTLRRFASKVVLSFDADGAGQNAAAKSGDLLVAEGFQVSVALLPEGEDPDTFVRRHGGDAYRAEGGAGAAVPGFRARPRGGPAQREGSDRPCRVPERDAGGGGPHSGGAGAGPVRGSARPSRAGGRGDGPAGDSQGRSDQAGDPARHGAPCVDAWPEPGGT